MAKKKLASGLKIDSIAPNLLMKDIENTAPFLFQNEIETNRPNREYLYKLIFYKKNSNQLKHLSLYEYFYLCLCAHWTTAGTYVPTDVDNLIRQKLWLDPQAKKHLQKMIDLTITAWKWDYSEVTKRSCFDDQSDFYISTHEGTWLSVAIGAYCAAKKFGLNSEKIEEVILQEIKNTENYLTLLNERQDSIKFISLAPLVAHNLGDLDRVMVAWDQHETDSFCKHIYKLGHRVSDSFSPLLFHAGKVNKAFTAKENHRHLSLRKSKALRMSKEFLVPVGPFMDDMGVAIGQSEKINIGQKAEIITALWDGINREQEAFGYMRVFARICNELDGGFSSFEEYLPFDVFQNIKKSNMYQHLEIDQSEFENTYKVKLREFSKDNNDLNF